MAQSLPAGGARGLVPPLPTHRTTSSSSNQNGHTAPRNDAFELYGLATGLPAGMGGYAGTHLRVAPPPLPAAGNGNGNGNGSGSRHAVAMDNGDFQQKPKTGAVKRSRAGRTRKRSSMTKSPGETRRFLEGDDQTAANRETPLSQRHRDWKIWPIYVKEAMERDRELTKDWDEDMDVLLIFAGLFSAVVTSFLSQNAIGNLSPPYDQYAAQIALLQLNSSKVPITPNCDDPNTEGGYNPACFQVAWQDQAVNGFWFAALTFSLAAALLAMLSKTWIREYSSGLASIPYDQARQRQFRYAGQKRWRLGAVINSLMMLLHISVFLFFAGLFVFLSEADYGGPVFKAVTILFALTLAIYAVVSSLPLIFPDCPYHFPLMKVFRVWILQKLRKERRGQTTFREQELGTIEKCTPVVEAAALAWVLRVSETSKEKEDVEDAALAAMDQLTQTVEQRKAMIKEGILNTLYRLFLDCDAHEEDRMVRILPAIEALWKVDDITGMPYYSKDRKVPTDDLHVAFFNKLVDILETSQSRKLLAAAIQLPKQFSGFPVAEWPIASRLSIPKMIDQLENDRFDTAAGLIAALNVITRIFCFSRTGINKQPRRSINQEDLRRAIPCVSEILILSRSTEVNTSALGVVDEIYQFFEHNLDTRAPSDWLKNNIDLFLNAKGLLPALLTQLSDRSVCRIEDKLLVRQVIDYLFRARDIREDCLAWVISRGHLEDITHDLRSFVWISEMNAEVFTPVYLFDQLSQEGRFTEHLDKFMNAGSVEALASYFSKDQNPIPRASTYAGLLRRLLRLVNGPQNAHLMQTGVMEIMARRAPTLLPAHLRSEAQQDLARQLDLVQRYITTGRLDPSLEPPVQVHDEPERDEPEEPEPEGGEGDGNGSDTSHGEGDEFLPLPRGGGR